MRLLKPAGLEPGLRNRRGHREKRMLATREQPPLSATRERPEFRDEDPVQPNNNNNKQVSKYKINKSRETSLMA